MKTIIKSTCSEFSKSRNELNVKVDINGGNEVYIGKNIIASFPDFHKKKNLFKNIFVIIDVNVKKLYWKELEKIFVKSAEKFFYISIDASEKNKTIQYSNKIYKSLINKNYGRDTLIVSIGGGVTGDIAGFVASTYLRGIQVVHISTTLLSMVDSSIGGKTGVNFLNYKNIIGSFYQPEFIINDINFLQTLSIQELNCGYGEIIKYAFLSDGKFFTFVSDYLSSENKREKDLVKLISNCCLIKSVVVAQDEREKSLRKILNFGHTFAHGFETASQFKLKHGEAVLLGIVSSLFLSYNLKIISYERLMNLISLPLKIKVNFNFKNFDVEKIYSSMLKDKKNRNGKIKFVLLKDIGELILDVEVNKGQVQEAIKLTIDKFEIMK